MFKWLYGHFLPHEGNEHQPHFLRSQNVQTLVIVLLISQAFFFIFTFFVIPQNNQVAAIIASTLVDQTNTERAKIKSGTLITNEKLTLSAQLKANDMAAKGYFSHDTPDGKDPWSWFRKSGYEYQYAGENLAVNFIESKDVTTAWMNSPTHRENLLNKKFTEVGIATALGKYKGRDAIFVVQHFGKPLKSTIFIDNVLVNKETQSNLANAKNVLGASTEKSFDLWAKLLSMTGSISISIVISIGLLSLIALLLAFFIRIKVQHPAILANGLVLVSITLGLAFINTIIIQGTI